MCVCHICVYLWGQKAVSNPLLLELQVVVICPTWMQETATVLFAVEGAQDGRMGCFTSYPGVIILLDCDCPRSWRSLEMLLAVLFRQEWHQIDFIIRITLAPSEKGVK